MKDFVLEEDVYITNEKVFGDLDEHSYDVTCYDGFAVGHSVDMLDNEPERVKLIYPKREEILTDEDRAEFVLKSRGLYDLTQDDIHFGDIMMVYGKISSYEEKTEVFSVVAEVYNWVTEYSYGIGDVEIVGVYKTWEDVLLGIDEFVTHNHDIEWDEDWSLFLEQDDPKGMHATYKGKIAIGFKCKRVSLKNDIIIT